MNGDFVVSRCDRFLRLSPQRKPLQQLPVALRQRELLLPGPPFDLALCFNRLLTRRKRRSKDQWDWPARECKAAKPAVIVGGQPGFKVVRVARVDALVGANYHVGVEFQRVVLTPSPRSSFESLRTNGRTA